MVPSLVPPRRLVGAYLMTAHLSLACAFLLTASNPAAVAGFFYHARIVAIVHLVTIGWIALSILGSIYVVLPLACGVAFRASRRDYVAYGLAVIGLIGMVAHFWIAEFGGMAWSAGTAAAGILYVVVRAAMAIRQAGIAPAVKLHFYFAAANLAGAVTLGVLLGFDKAHSFLPGYVLANVFAHAHLAAIGWVSMTILGFGYRLLPMVLPAAMPSGRRLYASAILLETGIVGLFVSLVLRSRVTLLFALAIVAAFAVFARHVIWMLEHPRRPPHYRSYPDFAVHHLAASAASLLFACVCGLLLAALPVSDATLRVALLYGVLGLVGFLAQAIVGFERRILPIASAYWMLQRNGGAPSPAPPRITAASWIFYAWGAGVPLVAAGLFLDRPAVLAFGAWLLAAGSLLMARNLLSLLFPWRYTSAGETQQQKGPASVTMAGP